MTSNSRTAGCGPACPVVWQGRLLLLGAPYADRCASRTGRLAVDNAFALPTAPAFAHKLHSLPPPSRKPEPQRLRPYRGDMYSDAGGV